MEFLFGAFCVLTAILLYPNEEGKIQSKLEDFWIRLDAYQRSALSRNNLFLQQIGKLETRILDRVFGHKLFSSQALVVSACCSILTVAIGYFLGDSIGRDDLWVPLMLSCVAIGLTHILKLSNKIRVVTIFISIAYIAVYFIINFNDRADNLDEIYPMLLATVLGGIPSDVAFIAATRKLIRWAGETKSSYRIAGILVLSLLLALAMISFLFIPESWADDEADWNSTQFLFAALAIVSVSNLLDASLALLFFFLCLTMLIHRAVWPLLMRTLFRVTDIGTKGRRAILASAGLGLLGLAGFGPPEWLKEPLKHLG
jgi:hypothetical protein